MRNKTNKNSTLIKWIIFSETNQIDGSNWDVNGRLRLADFLYAEYSLEEVIYQLAKTMFTQSLTHGSEQSQRALQRLTGFLEAEGSSGRISPALQKKILGEFWFQTKKFKFKTLKKNHYY